MSYWKVTRDYNRTVVGVKTISREEASDIIHYGARKLVMNPPPTTKQLKSAFAAWCELSDNRQDTLVKSAVIDVFTYAWNASQLNALQAAAEVAEQAKTENPEQTGYIRTWPMACKHIKNKLLNLTTTLKKGEQEG